MSTPSILDKLNGMLSEPELQLDLDSHASLLEAAKQEDRRFRRELIKELLADTIETLAWIRKGLDLIAQEEAVMRSHSDCLSSQLHREYDEQVAHHDRIRVFTTLVTEAYDALLQQAS